MGVVFGPFSAFYHWYELIFGANILQYLDIYTFE
jgi:hypothetical protein